MNKRSAAGVPHWRWKYKDRNLHVKTKAATLLIYKYFYSHELENTEEIVYNIKGLRGRTKKWRLWDENSPFPIK